PESRDARMPPARTALWRIERADRVVIVPDGRGSGPGKNEQVGLSDRENFLRRTGSAAVLAPLAIAVAFVGGWVFVAACLVAAALVLLEWSILVARAAGWRILAPGRPALCVAAVLAHGPWPGMAIAAVALGALAAAALAAAAQPDQPPAGRAGWAAGGVVYAGALLISPILLRSDPQLGFAALAFLFATVWA